MTFVHRWGGHYFRWIYHGEFYTKDGRHVGRLKGRKVYGVKGRYISELREYRLTASIAKAGRHWIGFIQSMRMATVNPSDLEPFDLSDDFPSPEVL